MRTRWYEPPGEARVDPRRGGSIAFFQLTCSALVPARSVPAVRRARRPPARADLLIAVHPFLAGRDRADGMRQVSPASPRPTPTARLPPPQPPTPSVQNTWAPPSLTPTAPRPERRRFTWDVTRPAMVALMRASMREFAHQRERRGGARAAKSGGCGGGWIPCQVGSLE